MNVIVWGEEWGRGGEDVIAARVKDNLKTCIMMKGLMERVIGTIREEGTGVWQAMK